MKILIQLKLVLIILIFSSCTQVGSFRLYSFDHESMAPNFIPGDMAIGLKNIQSLTYGDVVIYSFAAQFKQIEDIPFVWRIVALPGDTISVRNDICVINGKINPYRKIDNSVFFINNHWYDEYEETFPNGLNISILHSDSLSLINYKEKKVIIPEEHYYCLGDLRSDSYDSRYLGSLSKVGIQGKVVKVIKNKKGLSARWELFKYALWGHKKENKN